MTESGKPNACKMLVQKEVQIQLEGRPAGGRVDKLPLLLSVLQGIGLR